MRFPLRPAVLMASAALAGLSACGDSGLDFDMRGAFGNAPSTSDAARAATADRPRPDSRGVISYPSYQVAVARRGDTVADVAQRIGADVQAIASYNGLQPSDPLRDGEIVALPQRVTEPEGGPIRPGGVDITTLAGNAIDEADSTSTAGVQTSTLDPAPTAPSKQPGGTSGVEPVRHKVERGETAYSIARLYNVSVRSLAEWNGLGSDFGVREGQFLLIPVALPGKPKSALNEESTSMPGQGTQTPEPPSASKPLPDEETLPAAEEVETTAAPDMSSEASAPKGKMGMPVRGDIIRDYEKGKNDGIDIAASPGTAVNAAASGTVAAITEDTNGIPIIVVKHPDNLLTVYSNVGGVAVSKGDSVSRGQKLAEIRSDGTAAVHFEVREGFDSVDPGPYLQ
ncbi:LysM peptidoglycan-binding domain-containing M23 family metallopeptidase [Roseovarius indicus]|uniref:Murein hydrolase activator NlpD n=1 Tax=Roseovarius indicus TaxID=540747 RepID=A0A0T5P7V0_9RHOB|nr:LysM peptidoglycan-binding domain-containing M23 family metallopeptidase [Roseovarius indicus]KRS17410.1 peptidase M23B [Roseovarius indicus]QEW26592.1 Murein hydrolase activator NlpD precursor [Roseovarius indicus]SFD63034.1 Murein DD-endopeptidase MepM and murein hydrolase activator NlpD, contain LysM domain [Roseovarius indicus]